MTTEPTWREFDTLDGIDPRIKTEAFNQQKAIFEIVKHAGQLHSLLKDMIYHQSRMLEKWADGDDNVKNGLWKNLHDSGNKAREYLDSSEPTGKTEQLERSVGNTDEPLAASEKGLSMKDICEHIVKADLFEKPLTAEEIFNYSPTGELSRVFEWYAIACKVLGYSASENGTAASDGLPCPPYCPKEDPRYGPLIVYGDDAFGS